MHQNKIVNVNTNNHQCRLWTFSRCHCETSDIKRGMEAASDRVPPSEDLSIISLPC